MRSLFRLFALIFVSAWPACAAQAATGLAELAADAQSGPITVFYPAAGATRPEIRGAFALDVAVDAALSDGNRRLVIISHGSPASPWVYFDLARALVDAGFVVALPEHYADNYKDDSEAGPPSWRRRPVEVTQAIDRLAREPRFASALDFGRVGMYGMSAGGHAALSLAGGKWSPSRLRRHCQDHISEDFHACAGLSTSLTGGILDGLKLALVRSINDGKLDDPSWYGHTDARIAAIVSGVPFAADFDPDTFKTPSAAVGIVTARQDRWLSPRFHGDAVLQACRLCEHLLDLPTGGHGALLSPLPPIDSDLAEALIADPPGFDRSVEVPKLHDAIVGFFLKHLPRASD